MKVACEAFVLSRRFLVFVIWGTAATPAATSTAAARTTPVTATTTSTMTAAMTRATTAARSMITTSATTSRTSTTVACQPSCNFDSGLCGWNTPSGSKGWARWSGSTPSSGTGPSGAHSGAHYMYVESSVPNNPSHIFVLESPSMASCGTQQIRFYYHMYGLSMGTLNLTGLVSNAWTTIWSKSGNRGNTWRLAAVTVPWSVTKLRFVGFTGKNDQSDMSIDEIAFQQTSATNTTPRPTSCSYHVNVSGAEMQHPATMGIFSCLGIAPDSRPFFQNPNGHVLYYSSLALSWRIGSDRQANNTILYANTDSICPPINWYDKNDINVTLFVSNFSFSCTTGLNGAVCRTCRPQIDRRTDNHCESCNNGHGVSGKTCKAYSCNTANTGSACKTCLPQTARHKDNHCAACNMGHFLFYQSATGTAGCQAHACVTSNRSLRACKACKPQALRIEENDCSSCNDGAALDCPGRYLIIAPCTTGCVPWGSLTSLTTGHPWLQGTIHSEIGKLTNIQYLIFHSNQNTHLSSPVHNQLTGTIPSEVGKLSSLSFVDIRKTQLTGTIPSEVGKLSSMYWFFIDRNHLTGTIPSEVGKWSSLYWFASYSNQLTRTMPSEVGKLSSMTAFAISQNHLTGTIPSEVGKLNRINNFDIHQNQLTGTIPSEVWKLISMWWLQIRQTQLTGTIPPEVGKVSSMNWLLIDQNHLTGTIPSELGKLSSMNWFLIDQNQLTGMIPSEVGNLILLRNFDFHQNQLTGTIPSEVGKMVQLRDFDIHQNQLTGTIPSKVGHLSRLVRFSISQNQLTGTIPSEIGILQSLAIFNASHNQMTGTIPSLFGRLSRMYWLSLGDNFYTGKLVFSPPPSLVKVQLQNNNLSNLSLAWWNWRSQNLIGELDVRGNVHLHAQVLSPRRCPRHTRDFISNGNAFFADVNATYECTGLCVGGNNAKADPSLNLSMMCRCRPGYGGHRKDCFRCVADQYEDHNSDPNYLQTRCLACPYNSSTLKRTHRSSVDQCICSDGYEMNIVSKVCQPCAVGRYGIRPANGLPFCEHCAMGRFARSAGSTICNPCPEGFIASLPGTSSCIACAAGKYINTLGQTSCIDCPAGTFADGPKSSHCTPCPVGSVAAGSGRSVCSEACNLLSTSNADRSACTMDTAKLSVLSVYLLLMCLLVKLLAINTTRHFMITDVSFEQGRTLLTTLDAHRLWSPHSRPSFPIILRCTMHPSMDQDPKTTPKVQRAKVHTGNRLELLDKWGLPFHSERLDTSRGTVTLRRTDVFLRVSWPRIGVPIAAPVALIAVTCGLLASLFMKPKECFFTTLVAILGSLVVCGFLRRQHRKRASPLDQRLKQFRQRLHETNPNPGQCEKGPGRAIELGKLLDLHDCFQSFIRDRTAYYLSGNVIAPLTAKYELSYAEVVGPGKVDWFVSHFWGTAFSDFCASLQYHAGAQTQRAFSRDDTPNDWRQIQYWICFCSNNQYQVQDELGGSEGWKQSSFYLALLCPSCKGTCMVLDNLAKPLTRSWCIFEILQTLKLERSRDNFAGLLLCASSGVLNYGQGSVEAALGVARGVATLDLEEAQATKMHDKIMIDALVQTEMGTFDAMNEFVRANVREMLLKAEKHCSEDFDELFRVLKDARSIHDSRDADWMAMIPQNVPFGRCRAALVYL